MFRHHILILDSYIMISYYIPTLVIHISIKNEKAYIIIKTIHHDRNARESDDVNQKRNVKFPCRSLTSVNLLYELLAEPRGVIRGTTTTASNAAGQR